ncbi:MAG: hypothetical protein HW391_377 [Chloroflexi bacterium]|nr:hypothetical protein [Chloroflexota bacterium]
MSASRPGGTLEIRLAQLLRIGTYGAVILVGLGTALMVINGRSPLDVAPPLDPSRLVSDVLGGRPAGFIWLGVLLALATPTARVIAALRAFIRAGEREMTIVAGSILIVIALGVVAGTAGG